MEKDCSTSFWFAMKMLLNRFVGRSVLKVPPRGLSNTLFCAKGNSLLRPLSTASNVLRGNEEYRSFIDSLLKTKVSEYISLPTIASMGDTSSGKTSVLSSLTNIELPSSDQMTTRCPIMLQMRHSQSKRATVSVAWKDSSTEYPNFDPLHADESNWNDLTSMIELAQQHIVDTTNKEVARDVVSVDLEGPDCVNLTVVDLPGIVRTSGKGESTMLAGLTQGLIAEYMANPRCVILAIHPSNVDFHNSSIMADAKKLDPQTKRTFPVLTKPDLVDTGAEENVKKLLLGEKTDRFEQGFHMIKSRGQAALDAGTSIAQGLKEESTFFEQTEPWRSVPNQDLFGIPCLRQKLGKLQINMAKEMFPDIVKESLNKKKQQRRSSRVSALLSGRNTRVLGFDIILPSAQFHDESFLYREKLVTGRLYDPGRIMEMSEVIVSYKGVKLFGKVMKIKDDFVFVDIPFEKGKSHHPIGTLLENFNGNKDFLGIVRSEDQSVDVLRAVRKDDVSMIRRDRGWLRDLIKANRSYKVPVFANDEIFEKIVGKFLDEDWLRPSLELVDAVESIIQASLSRVLDHDSNVSGYPRLQALLQSHITAKINQIIARVRAEVLLFVQREKTPYTQNHYLNETLTALRVERLLEAATEALTKLRIENDEFGQFRHGGFTLDKKTVEATLQGVTKKLQKKTIEKYMEEEMEDALKAYGKVAFKRFIDCIPIICGDAMLNCPEQIRDSLANVPEEDIQNALSLTPLDLQRRKDLKTKVDELEKGLKIMRHLL